MQIVVEERQGVPIWEREVEIVERKGLGHPDTLCDGAMEAVSTALCRAYLETCGSVLHFNVDKGLLAAGRTEVGFGGGRMVEPMRLFIGDRAADRCGDRTIPVKDIAVAAAREWMGQSVRHLDPQRHLACEVVLAPGSEELSDIFLRPGETRGANDTSAAVGYAPLSPVENAVLAMEEWLNAAPFKKAFPGTGEDVKVMGVRRGKALDLTVAMPLLAGGIASEAEYFECTEAIRREMILWAETHAPFDTMIRYNALDERGRGLGGVYLTLLGTSAESGDSGQVGRGNRVNGLISLGRPLGTEAAAGKNPVSHAGKIYNVLAHELARKVHQEIEGVEEVYVTLVSRIGAPVDQPDLAAVQILPGAGYGVRQMTDTAQEIVRRELAGMGGLVRRLIRGESRMF